MTNEERRQAVALEKIARATEEFVKVFKAFNQNVVNFARAIQVQEETENPNQLTVFRVTEEDLASARASRDHEVAHGVCHDDCPFCKAQKEGD